MKYLILITAISLLLFSCKKEDIQNAAATAQTDVQADGITLSPVPQNRWTLLPSTFPHYYPYSDPTVGNRLMPVGDELYMLAGNVLESVFKYNSAAQKFEVHTPGATNSVGFTIFSAGHHYLFSNGNKIYGGLANNGSDTSFFFTIDPTTAVITAKTRFPGVKTPSPISFVIGNKGYVISGYNSSTRSQVWEYDFVTDAWTNKGFSPLGNRVGAVAFVLNNKVYMGLGYENSVFNGQSIWIYKKDWISYTPGSPYSAVKENFAGAGRISARGYVLNGQIYVGFGQNNSTQTRFKDFWKYNPISNTWKEEEAWPGIWGGNDEWYSGRADNVSLFSKGNAGFLIKAACNQLWRYSNSSLIIQ